MKYYEESLYKDRYEMLVSGMKRVLIDEKPLEPKSVGDLILLSPIKEEPNTNDDKQKVEQYYPSEFLVEVTFVEHVSNNNFVYSVRPVEIRESRFI